MRLFAMMMLCPAVALCAAGPLPTAYDVAVVGGGAAHRKAQRSSPSA